MSQPAARAAEHRRFMGRRAPRRLRPRMVIGRVAEFVGAAAGAGRDLHPLCRRRLALCLQQPDHLDRRAGDLPLPVAGDVRRRGGRAARRAHAADDICQLVSDPNGRNWLATVAELVVIVFVLELLVPTLRVSARCRRSTELITLHISDWYRVVALLVGAGLISIVALLRLLETTNLRGFFSALAARRRSSPAGCGWRSRCWWRWGSAASILFFVVIVAVCVGIGVPIAFTFGIATLSYLSLTTTSAGDDRRQPDG